MYKWNAIFDQEFLARLERLRMQAKALAARGAPGSRRARTMGDGLEFSDHRNYAPGDDIRFVDWPYYARMERLLLRLFHQHSRADVAVLLDCSGSMAPGGEATVFDYARRTAAALAYVAMAGLDRVVLATFADRIGQERTLGPNRERIFEALDFLSALVPAGPTALRASVEGFVHRRQAGGTAILLSDLLDCGEELSDALGMLRSHGWEPAVLQVYSPADERPELDGAVLLRQAETGQRMNLLASPELLESYRRQWQNHQQACQRTCLARQAAFVPVCTDVPFEMLVLRTLRRAGVLVE